MEYLVLFCRKCGKEWTEERPERYLVRYNKNVYTDDEKLHFYFKACFYFEWIDRLKKYI